MGYQSLGDVRQHDSHHSLVGMPEHASGAGMPPVPLDAIIVPGSRKVPNFEHAIGLAHAIGCKLVAICSHDVTAWHMQRMAASLSFENLIAIDLPDGYSHPLLDFETAGWLNRELPDACTHKSNLSAKRNIGLLLGTMLGWTRVFYLDDDIRNIEASGLRKTIAMLDDGYTVAGLRVTKFPDNSVVCHAHRATGGQLQGVFVSGSALAMDIEGAPGFFPEIYNEDWLSFYPAAVSGKLGLSDCHATQLLYDPFDTPHRAAWQEFGDMLAEGIYGLLHDRRDLSYATSDYWQMFLRARRHFLEDILVRTEDPRITVRPGLVECVETARKILTQVTPELCVHYVRLWQHDQVTWTQRLASIKGTATTIDQATRELRLPASGPTWETTLPMPDQRYGPAEVTAAAPQRPASLLQVALSLLQTTLRI